MLAQKIANVWESIARAQPAHPTVIYGENNWSNAHLDGLANALANALLEAELSSQSKVAVYLHNCPQFLAAYLGACKAGIAPLSVSFRHGPGDLLSLFDSSDTEAVIFDASLTGKLEEIRPQLPKIKLWLAVGANAPAWATAVHALKQGTSPLPAKPEEAGTRARAVPGPTSLIACPLVHKTSLLEALSALLRGGTVVLCDTKHFDAEALWNTVERWRVNHISIAEQTFATPMLDALDKYATYWNLSSLRSITSADATWSPENKHGLLRHLPHLTLSASAAAGLT